MSFTPNRASIACLSLAMFLLGAAIPARAANPAMAPVATGKISKQLFNVKSAATPVNINRGALARLARQDEMDFTMPDGKTYAVVFDRLEDHGGGIHSSIGYLKAHGKDFRVIITAGPSGTFGSIRTPETTFEIFPGVTHDWIVDQTEEAKHAPPIDLRNDVRRPPIVANAEKPAQARATTLSAGAGNEQPIALLATPVPQTTIDIMIVYTNGLAARLGPALLTRLYNLVAAANTGFSDSEVAITMRLVNATMVNYSDVSDDGVALDEITPAAGGGGGVFSNIEAIRTASGADLVSFLRSGSDFSGYGIAWLTGQSISASHLYSVVTGCVVGCNVVFMHEIGHNLGNNHDRATEAASAGGTPNPAGGAFSYSFGHYYCASGSLTCNPFVVGGCGTGANITLPQCTTNNVNNVGTIMSYFNPRTLKYSNPNLMCAPGGGGGISQLCGVAGVADNALSMNNMRVAIAAAKPTTMMSLTVIRNGTGTGNVASNPAGIDTSISVSTATFVTNTMVTLTATPAVDSTFTGWTGGGCSGTGTCTVTLTIAQTVTATFTLLPEVFPVNCAIPADWVVTPGATTGWSVVTDRKRSGACSLKSNAMPNAALSGAANANKAQIQVTGDFSAGNVSFFYNVLSEFRYDCLRFSIDGLSQAAMGNCDGVNGNGGLGASGDISIWTPVSIAVPSGLHTFLWSYEKDDQVAPTGDAAWIDDVVLPPPAATGTLQFTANAIAFSEAAGNAVITVSRTGGSSGAATVSYTTVPGTATAPSDFTMQSGMLNWANGDVANKTITVPIINDALIEGDETFTITLSSPTGATLSSPSTITVTIIDNDFATAPGVPTAVTATAGNAQASVNFSAPASNGGSPITGYSATCTGPATVSVSAAFAPIVVAPLTNGGAYSCTVVATNAIGSSMPSASVNVMPANNVALALSSVVSRKVHTNVGPLDIPIDRNPIIGGPVSVEPRFIGSGHTIVFQFNNTVTGAGMVTTTSGNATPTFSGSEVLVTLTNVPDNSRATVTLTGVPSANGSADGSVSIGFLVGDVSNSRSVNASDIAAIKAHLNQIPNTATARFDLNASGTVNATDVSAVKARAGIVLP